VQEKSKGRWGMDAATDFEAHGAFYRAEEGGEMIPWRRKQSTVSGVIQCFFFSEKRGRGCAAHFWRERSMRGNS
jgi:hypothetical protein